MYAKAPEYYMKRTLPDCAELRYLIHINLATKERCKTSSEITRAGLTGLNPNSKCEDVGVQKGKF